MGNNREPALANSQFWHNKRVLVTGHTGFKGAWLCLWLARMGARVSGFALAPATQPSLFLAADVASLLAHTPGDMRDLTAVGQVIAAHQPEIVLHLAAQALVRPSYREPIDTFATNVMGTVHLLDSVRRAPSVRAVVVVTSDKCYDNREWAWGYRENEPLGGRDPYSASKACAELVTAAYRQSFFADVSAPAVATARAGNVIGGGDWAEDRLVPDILRGFAHGDPVHIRHPAAVRPWQHVLEPLNGYLVLAERLCQEGHAYSSAWNFGPTPGSEATVGEVAAQLQELWGGGDLRLADAPAGPHEAGILRLDPSKALLQLGVTARLDLATSLRWTVEWQKAFGDTPALARALCEAQIAAYEAIAGGIA